MSYIVEAVTEAPHESAPIFNQQTTGDYAGYGTGGYDNGGFGGGPSAGGNDGSRAPDYAQW